MPQDEYTDDARITDALSYIVGQTAKEVAERAGLGLRIAQRVLKHMERDGWIERRGNRYRLDNGLPWASAKNPLPPNCTIEHVDGSKYKVS